MWRQNGKGSPTPENELRSAEETVCPTVSSGYSACLAESFVTCSCLSESSCICTFAAKSLFTCVNPFDTFIAFAFVPESSVICACPSKSSPIACKDARKICVVNDKQREHCPLFETEKSTTVVSRCSRMLLRLAARSLQRALPVRRREHNVKNG